jgi:hypothetical protein
VEGREADQIEMGGGDRGMGACVKGQAKLKEGFVEMDSGRGNSREGGRNVNDGKKMT